MRKGGNSGVQLLGPGTFMRTLLVLGVALLTGCSSAAEQPYALAYQEALTNYPGSAAVAPTAIDRFVRFFSSGSASADETRSEAEDLYAGDLYFSDTLLTSGFGGVVPKGFPVAVVTKVATARDGLSLRVEARSEIKFRSLEEIFVMTDEIPWERAIYYDAADSALVDSILGEER